MDDHKFSKNEFDLTNKRVRFLIFSENLPSENILEKIECSGYQFYSHSFFYSHDLASLYLPVQGPKAPTLELLALTKNANLKIEIRDIVFLELQSFNVSNSEGNLSKISEEYQKIINAEGQLGQKKLLVELNSKDLALHFFN